MKTAQIPQYSGEDITRFWSKVNKKGPVMEGPHYAGLGNCWEWTSGLFNEGYGSFKGQGVTRSSHRVAYHLSKGEIPEGKLVMHKCDNRKCCRPSHLECGDFAANNRDSISKGRNAKGDRNGSVTQPHTRPRGKNHFAQSRPGLLARGESAGNAVLTTKQVLKIREEYARKRTRQVDLARRYGVSQHAVSCVVRRITWTHV
jgi:hypothetical protein